MALSTVSIVLFPGFELLDAFGPASLLKSVPGLSVTYLGPSAGAVVSSQGVEVIATAAYDDALPADMLLVPGGIGTRELVDDRDFLRWLADFAGQSQLVTSVCTGSGLLAAAGLLDGSRATSNKRAFTWAKEQSGKVEWIAQARWVEDGNRWTSSGVTAGMDMTAALIERWWGSEVAQEAADRLELEIHQDAAWDPFAVINGLV